ncbi:MAG: hypothetical protein IJ572_03035, partial [Bacilli bacterium]|nr:hypothetical protein [Bacilli bacterium]
GYTITSSDQYYYGRMDSKKWYEAERNNRSSNNELTWTGNLGLMYPSEVGTAICSQTLLL